MEIIFDKIEWKPNDPLAEITYRVRISPEKFFGISKGARGKHFRKVMNEISKRTKRELKEFEKQINGRKNKN